MVLLIILSAWASPLILPPQPAIAMETRKITADWAGPPHPVFDSGTEGCDDTDIPDQTARAFRDDSGTVHLFATHFVARAMVGKNLNFLKRDCHVVYRSPEDADPSHFADRNWLASFYTEDGKHIVALLHSEYEAATHPGMCAAPNAASKLAVNCWWNTITMATSNDSGHTFIAPVPPSNLVASLPYPYDRHNTTGPFGYEQPTNIVKHGQHYYAMIQDWPYKSQKYGPCLIRTNDPFDGSSWRAWDGMDFTIHFVNPYRELNVEAQGHVCPPVGAKAIYAPGSLSFYSQANSFLTLEYAPDDRFGSPGLYISASPDLINWSRPARVADTEAMLRDEPAGKWRYDYFSLLDPTSADQNFSDVSDAPFVYYVRFDLIRGNLSRTLMRRQIHLRIEK